MTEIWKDIIGYEGLYQISNQGNVKSSHSGAIVKQQVMGGYKYVSLHKEKKLRTHRVHRLVAQAFIPNPESKPQINHINGIKTDNRADNLEWCTQSENMKHAYENGLQIANTEKANEAKRKLNDAQVAEIKRLLESGQSTRSIAKMFGVGKTLISNINRGKVKGYAV